MKRFRKSGFSILEVLAAAVILSVVAAAAVATVAPMRAKSENWHAHQELASLNAMAQTYHQEEGQYPANAADLVHAGYLTDATADKKLWIARIHHEYSYSHTTGVFSKK